MEKERAITPGETGMEGEAADAVVRLISIMAALRDPISGCPWDIKQDFKSIAPYTIEEAYEVADAIERGDIADLKDELGDLLLQVVYHARMAEELGLFTFETVTQAICDKLIRRHPHVFGNREQLSEAAHSLRWDDIKKAERALKKGLAGPVMEAGPFDDIPVALPALTRSAKIQRRAARAGFDWPRPEPIFEKIQEEIEELKAEVSASDEGRSQRQFEEYGDLLFAVVNLGRHLGIDGESALAAANRKFMHRYEAMEKLARAEGRVFDALSLDEQEDLWQRVKATG